MPLANDLIKSRYSIDEDWNAISVRVAYGVYKNTNKPMDEVFSIQRHISKMRFIPAGRYLRGVGTKLGMFANCMMLRAKDSREGWGDLLNKVTLAIMTGAGVGINYSGIRPAGSDIASVNGKSQGVLPLIKTVNAIAENVAFAGSRYGALMATLHWSHGDILNFISMKDGDAVSATNISVLLDDDFFNAYGDVNHHLHNIAQEVYWASITSMLKSGEPGFFVVKDGNDLVNPCGEAVSKTSHDICNLGSINLSKLPSDWRKENFSNLVRQATDFLVLGGYVSSKPYRESEKAYNQNGRIGLGLMGVAHFGYKNGLPYGLKLLEALRPALEIYQETSQLAADVAAIEYGAPKPMGIRAIAPTGTLSLIASTTPGIEPLFAKHYTRLVKNGDSFKEYLVEDPVYASVPDEYKSRVLSSVDLGLSLEGIETRLAFQAGVQCFVDQAISTTLNLPNPYFREYSDKDFGDLLMKYLPAIKGVTVYPNGARDNQPFQPTNMQCRSGVCGS